MFRRLTSILRFPLSAAVSSKKLILRTGATRHSIHPQNGPPKPDRGATSSSHDTGVRTFRRASVFLPDLHKSEREAGMPEKRALVCGVADYAHLQQTNIPGALTAARAWAVRLQRFGYQPQNILLWEDAQATKASVLAQLRRMFAASGEDDDVMFIIACHGTSIPRDAAVGEEQGLVLYPEEGNELLDATLFGPEIAEAAKAAEHGEKTHF